MEEYDCRKIPGEILERISEEITGSILKRISGEIPEAILEKKLQDSRTMTGREIIQEEFRHKSLMNSQGEIHGRNPRGVLERILKY